MLLGDCRDVSDGVVRLLRKLLPRPAVERCRRRRRVQVDLKLSRELTLHVRVDETDRVLLWGQERDRRNQRIVR